MRQPLAVVVRRHRTGRLLSIHSIGRPPAVVHGALRIVGLGSAVQAKAAFEAAQQPEAQAEINLRRTEVRSPVNGYVTNLQMRVGDYAHQGSVNISIIDTDSYWIDGYFEETKLAGVCVGDRVEAKLMGYAQPVLGHVVSVTRGIVVSDAAAGTQGLPTVNPVFTWVRLAQRLPVRIAIDRVPPGVPLVSGLSATVTIQEGAASAAAQSSWLGRAVGEAEPDCRMFCMARRPGPDVFRQRPRSEQPQHPYQPTRQTQGPCQSKSIPGSPPASIQRHRTGANPAQ
jgi:hypothetical protein